MTSTVDKNHQSAQTYFDRLEGGHAAGGSLTAEQVKFYNTEGYVVLPHLLNDDDLRSVRQTMADKVSYIAEDLFAAGLVNDRFEDRGFDERLARLFEHLTDQDFLKYGRGWRDRLPGYFDLMSNAKILDAVESLIGAEIFANPVYNVRPKVPNVAAGAVPWHQDKSYWPDANSNPVITVWVAVVEANEVNGCLYIWPRTHKTQLMEHRAETYSGTAYTEVDTKKLKRSKIVPLPLAAGGAILFNDRCVHMSTPNNSSTVRWSVDLRYQPTDQDPMPQHGAGFLARSARHPERIADLNDWLAARPEHEGN